MPQWQLENGRDATLTLIADHYNAVMLLLMDKLLLNFVDLEQAFPRAQLLQLMMEVKLDAEASQLLPLEQQVLVLLQLRQPVPQQLI